MRPRSAKRKKTFLGDVYTTAGMLYPLPMRSPQSSPARSRIARAVLVPLVIALCLLGSTGVASAQADPYTTPPPRGGPPADVPTREVVFTPRSSPVRQRSLPVTGGDVIALTVMGGGAVALGWVLLAARRRPALR